MSTIEVRSASGHTYSITARQGKTPFCTCPAWRNDRGPSAEKTCKHIKGLAVEELAALTWTKATVPQPVAPPAPSHEITPGLLTSWAPGLDPTAWAASAKLDGMRILLHIVAGATHAYSRGEAVKGVGSRDGFLVALEEELTPWLATLDDTVLDGEAVVWEAGQKPDFNLTMRVMGSSREVAIAKQRQSGHHVSLAVFDVLRLKGQDTRHLKYEERQLLVDQIGALKMPHLIVVPSMKVADMGGFDAAYERMIELVEEGVVYKRLGSTYPSGRSADWLRRKAVFDTDAVITGFEMAKPGKFGGMIGAVLFSQWRDGKLEERGKASGMTDAVRQHMTDHPEEYVDKVAVFAHNGKLAAGGLRHPQWRGLRLDGKRSEECEWE